jgi:4-hydroxy-3-methylbut-2-en-1-yl diphosphate reductase
MIGHKGHPEVEGTMGQLERASIWWKTPKTCGSATHPNQKAGGGDANHLERGRRRAHHGGGEKARFPQVREPKQQDICYATQNRQDAIKLLSPQVDVVIVVGSPTSSNSNRLRDVAAKYGTPSYMVDHAGELQAEWLEGASKHWPDRRGLCARHLGAASHHPIARAWRGVGAHPRRCARNCEISLPKGLRHD